MAVCLSLPPALPAQVRNLAVQPAAAAATPALPAEPTAPAPVAAPDAAVTLPPPVPANITDVLVLLNAYRPDESRVARLQADMDRPVDPSETNPARLAEAWHRKSLAAARLQAREQRLEFLERALPLARSTKDSVKSGVGSYARVRYEYAVSLDGVKGMIASQDSLLQYAAELEAERGGAGPRLLPVYAALAENHSKMGDRDAALQALSKADNLLRIMRPRVNNAATLNGWSALVELSRGLYYRGEGKHDLAERAFRASMRLRENVADSLRQREDSGTDTSDSAAANSFRSDSAEILLALTLNDLGRLNEAELTLREVLKRTLARDGRGSSLVGRALWGLALVHSNKGHFAEAVVLAQWADKALSEAGLSAQTSIRLNARLILANLLVSVGRPQEAIEQFRAIKADVIEDARLDEGYGQGSLSSIRAYLQVGQFKAALSDAESLLAKRTRHYGEASYDTAEARAYRAFARHRNGDVAGARKDFDTAIAILIDPARNAHAPSTSARTLRLKAILDDYINILSTSGNAPPERDLAEAFRLADVARWQSVQKAVTGSAIRSAAGSPELGTRIKRVQDAEDEIQAVYRNLITQRSAPPDRQLPSVIAAMEARIDTLQKEQQQDLLIIRRQFPQYDDLVNPKPADLAAARKALQPGEALLSIYVAGNGAYSWATDASGALQFSYQRLPKGWLKEQVRRVRDSVDLASGRPLDRMAFDLAAASAIYDRLLKPVESAWAKASTLLVVANDVLGQIPLSLLPTGPTPAAAAGAERLPFADLRQTPWLARRVAISYLPSVSALVTLRNLPPSRQVRGPFIGFGDPDFAAGAATNAAPAAGPTSRRVRNLSVQRAKGWDESIDDASKVELPPAASAEALAATTGAEAAAPSAGGAGSAGAGTAAAAAEPVLAPLPDTRDEIAAIAAALAADPARDVFLGPAANRHNVLQSDLKNRRVLAFATHGLVAGDLPGLDQPALALTPDPGQPVQSGLLRLEDILKLSIDADLVVLSACNTAAADGTGAEAVSGLGRGFFYAGARSILATHWPVETVSARQLVTVLFERYAKDPKMTRAQALRQAMIELIDKGAAMDGRGQAVMSYAHPAFWAPYALYGDAGR